MMELVRTNSENEDFAALVKMLDADLAMRDGEIHLFYDQFNKITKIKHVIVAYENAVPLGCGAIKEFDNGIMEIKRMYVLPSGRTKGMATTILAELEKWAAELGCGKCVLETGNNQPEAIALYKKNGFRIIPNYGQYAGIENSICFEKAVNTEGEPDRS